MKIEMSAERITIDSDGVGTVITDARVIEFLTQTAGYAMLRSLSDAHGMLAQADAEQKYDAGLSPAYGGVASINQAALSRRGF